MKYKRHFYNESRGKTITRTRKRSKTHKWIVREADRETHEHTEKESEEHDS